MLSFAQLFGWIIAGCSVAAGAFCILRARTHRRSLIDAVGAPLALIDSRYTIREVNSAYSSLAGASGTKPIGKRCYHVLRERNAPCVDCMLQRAIEHGSTQILDRSPHPRDADHAVTITFRPFRDGRGAVHGIVEHIEEANKLDTMRFDIEQRSRILDDATTRLRKQRQDLDEELDLARQVQQSIMPQTPPRFDGLRMALTYHPIEAVGGDLYDFIPFSKEKLGLFIGDASGHGLASSLVSTISKMSLYNHSKTEIPADRLIENLNNDLRGNIRSSSTTHYLTCFWGIFDARDNSLTYSRAGHPMPIVVRANGEVRLLNATGTFAGILESPFYEQKKFFFRKGDRCYLCTDGIFEVMVKPGKPQILGFKRFKEIVAEINDRPFDTILPALHERLESYTYEDDYTLLAFEVTADTAFSIEESLPGFSIDDDISFIRFSRYEEADRYFNLFFRKLGQAGYADTEKIRIKLCLEELVANALKHGNRFAPNKSITVAYSITDTQLKLCVVDEGEGFDMHRIPDPTLEVNIAREGGRGLYLIRNFTDTVGQNRRGNGVFFVKSRKQVA
jgi:serine phosphatase RsbU (regulator of sigma subunit)/anti-sigma regulatory factor (Ser/Thr protein kinase)